MAFQAEQKIKSDILRGLSTEQLFQLLSDSDVNVLMKTLGLLRNLLSTRPVSRAANRLSSDQTYRKCKWMITFFWQNKDFGWEYKMVFCLLLFDTWPKLRALLSIYLSICKQKFKPASEKLERILYIHWNLVTVTKYRTRQLYLIINSITFSFPQNFPEYLSVKLVQNSNERVDRKSVV